MYLIWFLLAVVAVSALLRYQGLRKRRDKDAAFAGRPALEPVEFHDRFFRAQGVPMEIVLGVRKVLEAKLGEDLSRLVASDDFTKNIRFFLEYDSLADVEIVCGLEEEFSIRISNEEAAKAHTIQDIVDLVWRKCRSR